MWHLQISRNRLGLNDAAHEVAKEEARKEKEKAEKKRIGKKKSDATWSLSAAAADVRYAPYDDEHPPMRWERVSRQ
jgi:hypothetical protein